MHATLPGSPRPRGAGVPVRPGVVAVVLALLVAIVATAAHPLTRARVAVYSLYRSLARERTLLRLRGTPVLEGPHFRVFYPSGDRHEAEMVLTAAEAAYGPVVSRLGARPRERAVVVVEPDAESLRRAFGWGSGEWAAGAYWGGVIRVLSPSAWVPGTTPGERERSFRFLNPLTHEFTHYVLDLLARGNYPRWFSEGLAQRYEYEVTGYRWLVPGAWSPGDPLYSLTDLDARFDALDNQPLAYRQSHELVDFLAARCGEPALGALARKLGAGVPFPVALREVCGLSVAGLEVANARAAGLRALAGDRAAAGESNRGGPEGLPDAAADPGRG